jgi:hypothetical protein
MCVLFCAETAVFKMDTKHFLQKILPKDGINQYAEKLGYHDLIDAKPNERWWLNRLEKMQS